MAKESEDYFAACGHVRILLSTGNLISFLLQKKMLYRHKYTNTQTHTYAVLWWLLPLWNGIRPTSHNPSMFAWCVWWLSLMPGLVKNSGRTVSCFSCYQKKVVFLKSAEKRELSFFLLIFAYMQFCLFHSDCIFFTFLLISSTLSLQHQSHRACVTRMELDNIFFNIVQSSDYCS